MNALFHSAIPFVLSLGGIAACAKHEAALDFSTSERPFSGGERKAIQQIADATMKDARALLPMLPPDLRLTVRTDTHVIPETGETAESIPPNAIVWKVDPGRSVLHTIQTQLRPTLFHELHHLARALTTPANTLVDMAIDEGLATAFERDVGHVNPPWGEPPPDGVAWTRELLRVPERARRDEWLFEHPDGRRWIAMRAGTFIVDQATRHTGKSPAQMVAMPSGEILEMAKIDVK